MQLDDLFKIYSTQTGEELTVMDIAKAMQEYIGSKGYQQVQVDKLTEYYGTVKHKKVELLNFLIKRKTSDNRIDMSIREIAEQSGVSKNTVATTMKELQEKGMVKRMAMGRYVLNPNICIRGGAPKYVAAKLWESTDV